MNPAVILPQITGGARILSGWLVIGVNPGETFLDRMIAWWKVRSDVTPNSCLTIPLIAIVAPATPRAWQPFSREAVFDQRNGSTGGTAGLANPNLWRPVVSVGVAGVKSDAGRECYYLWRAVGNGKVTFCCWSAAPSPQ